MNKTRHVSLRVTEEQKQALEHIAQGQDLTVAQLLRRAVQELTGAPGSRPVAVLPPARRLTAPSPRREAELAWLAQHQGQLGRFAGEWIVLDGSQLVAHGPDYLEVLDRARDQGVEVPFVEWIPEASAPTVWMGL
ncbi:MAG: hypothetical protein HY319_31705 [Armatimonadetes bacterium]|nr:hypothetical protein [Armatimonadota bacterium]